MNLTESSEFEPTQGNRPAIAVLICVYRKDEADWLKMALESIFNQTYGFGNIRIYLGVNGEVGQGIEAVLSWAESRIHTLLRSDRNLMLSGMLNRLIGELGDEPYVARMDADDISHPTRFEKQVDFLESHPEVDVLGTGILEIDAAGREIGRRSYRLVHEDILLNMHKGTAVGHSTVCMRKTTVDRLGGYDLGVKTAEDLELWFRAFDLGLRFANLPDFLFIQRFHGANFANRSFGKAVAEFKVYWKGCLSLFGVSPKLVYPVVRFVLRLMPTPIVALLYRSGLRRMVFRSRGGDR